LRQIQYTKYDIDGRLRERIDATGLVVTLDYDVMGNINSQTYTGASDSVSLTRTWTGTGQVETETSQVGLKTINTYDGSDRLIEVTDPAIVVCLGATAAQSLLGASFRVTQQRGKVLSTESGQAALATVHPSSLLRMPDREERHRAIAEFAADLKVAADFARKHR
jgi:YD repeat-containing protein